MRKVHKSTARIRKFLTSMVVLLIFLFPMAVSARWLYDVAFDSDSRKVYSKNDLTDFGQSCQPDTGNLLPFDEPLITITFDDGWESIYSEGLGVLQKHCVKTTQYILGGHFDDTQYLSEKQVRSMQDAGHEIASHTMTHADLTKLPKSQLVWELGEADKTLSNKFGEMREFATPLGASNDLVIEHIKKYYRSHRNTLGDPATVGDEDINVQETFDRYNITAFTVNQETTLEDIRNLIDYTSKRKGWLVLTYHQVGDDESEAYYAVSRQTLEKHLRIIKDSDVRTASMGPVLDAIEKRNQ